MNASTTLHVALPPDLYKRLVARQKELERAVGTTVSLSTVARGILQNVLYPEGGDLLVTRSGSVRRYPPKPPRKGGKS